MAFTHIIVDRGREVGNRHQHDTVAQAQECEDQYAECRAEQEAEAGYERWLEDGGPHAAQIQWENEQDRLRTGGF
jgi:hypothetical protein